MNICLEISMRQSVNLKQLGRHEESIVCPTCKGPVSLVENRSVSVVWYCSRCDVYPESTARGVVLRTFKKDQNQVFNLKVGE